MLMRRTIGTALAAGVMLLTATVSGLPASARPAPVEAPADDTFCVWSDFYFTGENTCDAVTYFPKSMQIRSFVNNTFSTWGLKAVSGECWNYPPEEIQGQVDFGEFRFVRVVRGGC
jgi:hypothetical protein